MIFSDNFSDGEIGQRPFKHKGYSSSSCRYFYHREYGMVLKDDIVKGKQEWNGGWVWNYPDNIELSEGDSVQFSVSLVLPTDADYSAPGYALKFMRVHTPSGHIDLYLARDGSWFFIREGKGNHKIEMKEPGWERFMPVPGNEETYTFKVMLSEDPKKGRMTFWKNSELVGDAYFKTLRKPDDVSNRLLVRTYWNGGAPKDQTWYWTGFNVEIVKSNSNPKPEPEPEPTPGPSPEPEPEPKPEPDDVVKSVGSSVITIVDNLKQVGDEINKIAKILGL